MNAPRLLALVFAAAAVSGCGPAAPTPAADSEPAGKGLAVRVQPAATRLFERRLAVQGSLEARHVADVAARVAGNLDQLWVEEGDPVRAGETPLFQIDPVGRSNELAIAREALSVAQAALAVREALVVKSQVESRKAELDFARYRRLHEQGRVSDHEFESASTLRAQAEAARQVAESERHLAARQVAQAEAALAIAEKNLADTRVLAPLTGVVSRRLAEPGEQMTVGRAILRLEDPTRLEAAAFLPAQYYADAIPGQTRFRLAVNDQEAGLHTITYRSPTVDTTLRTFEIKGRVALPAALAVPGARADLALVFESRDALGIPSAAILIRNGAPIVFVVRDGRAVQTPVETGLEHDGWTEIRAGLAAGDPVVVEGQSQLLDQTPVNVL